MARPAARTSPTLQEMQVALSRWQDVLMHISSAWGEPGVPTWHGPVVMARYRMDALAAAQEIAALLERMSRNAGAPNGGAPPGRAGSLRPAAGWNHPASIETARGGSPGG
jgi:hypothetical protein